MNLSISANNNETTNRSLHTYIQRLPKESKPAACALYFQVVCTQNVTNAAIKLKTKWSVATILGHKCKSRSLTSSFKLVFSCVIQWNQQRLAGHKRRKIIIKLSSIGKKGGKLKKWKVEQIVNQENKNRSRSIVITIQRNKDTVV